MSQRQGCDQDQCLLFAISFKKIYESKIFFTSTDKVFRGDLFFLNP